MNRSILSVLTSTVEDGARWDETLSQVRWGINSTINSTTGKSPYEVFFGYRPRGINDAFLASEVINDERRDLKKLRDGVADMIQERQSSQKEYYDKRHAAVTSYSVGQHVLVQAVKDSNEGNSKKLEPRYKGPFLNKKVLDNDRYVISELPGSKRSRVAYTGIYPSEKKKKKNCL